MIRTVLIDDEIDSIRVLQRLLEGYCPEVSIVGKADGVEMGVHVIQSTKPDLVFLDIEMTHGNAFDLLNQLQPVEFQVIFVTAFDNYAIRAFKYSAVDYLLKPIDIDDLRASLGRVLQRVQGKTFVDQMETLLYNVETFQLTQQKMAVPTLTACMAEPATTYSIPERMIRTAAIMPTAATATTSTTRSPAAIIRSMAAPISTGSSSVT